MSSCLNRSCLFARGTRKKLIDKDAFASTYMRLTSELNVATKYKDLPVTLAKKNYNLLLSTAAVYEPGKPNVIGNTFNMWHDPGIVPLDDKPPSVIIEHIAYLFLQSARAASVRISNGWSSIPIRNSVRVADYRRVRRRQVVDCRAVVCAVRSRQRVLEKGERVLSKFNKELANRQVIFVDELVPDGKTDLAKGVATLITAPTMTVEPKGVSPFRYKSLQRHRHQQLRERRQVEQKGSALARAPRDG